MYGEKTGFWGLFEKEENHRLETIDSGHVHVYMYDDFMLRIFREGTSSAGTQNPMKPRRTRHTSLRDWAVEQPGRRPKTRRYGAVNPPVKR